MILAAFLDCSQVHRRPGPVPAVVASRSHKPTPPAENLHPQRRRMPTQVGRPLRSQGPRSVARLQCAGCAFTKRAWASQLFAIGSGCGAGLEHRGQLFAAKEGVEHRRIHGHRPVRTGFRWRSAIRAAVSLVVMPPCPHFRPPPSATWLEACQSRPRSCTPPRWPGAGHRCGAWPEYSGPPIGDAHQLIERDRHGYQRRECVVVAEAQTHRWPGLSFIVDDAPTPNLSSCSRVRQAILIRRRRRPAPPQASSSTWATRPVALRKPPRRAPSAGSWPTWLAAPVEHHLDQAIWAKLHAACGSPARRPLVLPGVIWHHPGRCAGLRLEARAASASVLRDAEPRTGSFPTVHNARMLIGPGGC